LSGGVAGRMPLSLLHYSPLQGSRPFSSSSRKPVSERVEVADEQDAPEKRSSSLKIRFASVASMSVNDRPRIEKHDLDIEQDEEHPTR